MRHVSTESETNHDGFALFDISQPTTVLAQLFADRPSAATRPWLLASIETGQDAPSGRLRLIRPLYRGQEMGSRWNIGLRLLGAALIGAALVALWWLFARIHPGNSGPATLLNFALGSLFFFGATCGSALLILGTHIFDAVEVSERWRPRP